MNLSSIINVIKIKLKNVLVLHPLRELISNEAIHRCYEYL
jgi:hypothetical protein